MPIKTNIVDLAPTKTRLAKTVRLPSGGLSCPKAFPDGTISVLPWSADVDDFIIKITSQAEEPLLPADFLSRVLRHVVNLNGCSINDFVASEVVGLLMISRSLTRNDTVTVNHACPVADCRVKENVLIRIPDDLAIAGAKDQQWPGYDEITLPVCKDVVRIRPLRVGEELAVTQRTSSERAATVSDTAARVLAALVSINGTTPDNAAEASTWWKALPPEDERALIDFYAESQPRWNTRPTIVCRACGHKEQYQLSLDRDFFR